MQHTNVPALVSGAVLVAGVILPLLTLVPFGWIWLWQNGYILYWLAGTFALSAIMIVLRMWALRRIKTLKLPLFNTLERGACEMAPREAAAWRAIEAIADDTDPRALGNREAVIALAQDTVEAVARQMHPGVQDPIWKFTVPEALALIETVSRRLRPMIADNIPLGDRLTIGQMLRIYSWRGLVGKAEKAYDIWRMLRVINPVAAVTQEARERLSKMAYDGLKEELAKRIARIFVNEVGRAAIELYSGRLRLLDQEDVPDGGRAAPAGTVSAEISSEPLRLLIAGQTGVGKSSLINALGSQVQAAVDVLPTTRDFVTYNLKDDTAAPLVLIDSPGIGSAKDIGKIADMALECDLMIWVAAANRADRKGDADALAALRARFAELPQRQPPPLLLAVTYIDRLRPFQEWAPPYDVADPQKPKERSIRDAMDAIGADLAFQEDTIVPVAVPAEGGAYNIDVLYAKLIELLPTAKSVRLLRHASATAKHMDWRKLLSQARNSGRIVSALLVSRQRKSDQES